MADLRALAPIAFNPPPVATAPAGAKPVLTWLPLSALRVDARYQRDIVRRGARNIRHIVEHFDWALFTPVVCVEIEKPRGGQGVYAIIDGQHRATAALMHPAIREVPCSVVAGDLAAQARAFVAINNQVTRLTSLQIHAAALAAGEPAARDIARCCAAAGARVPAYPKPRGALARGETLAIGAIRDCVVRFGAYRTGLALKALVDQDEAGWGLVNRDTIKGLAEAIAALGEWAKDKDLFLGRAAGLALGRLEDEAAVAALAAGGSVASHFTRLVVAALTGQGFGPSTGAPARQRAATKRGRGSY